MSSSEAQQMRGDDGVDSVAIKPGDIMIDLVSPVDGVDSQPPPSQQQPPSPTAASTPSDDPVQPTTSSSTSAGSSTELDADALLKGAVIKNADSDDSADEGDGGVASSSAASAGRSSASSPSADSSPLGELTRVYLLVQSSSDPASLLSLFAPYFARVFALRLETPCASRALYAQDEALQFFMKNLVPNLVRQLMTLDTPPGPRTQAPIIHRFLQACIVVCIHGINMDVTELLLTLTHLLGSPVADRLGGPNSSVLPRSFYLSCGLPRIRGSEYVWEEDEMPLLADVATRVQNVVPPFPLPATIGAGTSTSVAVAAPSKSIAPRAFTATSGKKVQTSSWYLLRNVQFFGAQGGFYVLLDRLRRGAEAQKRIGIRAKNAAATDATESTASTATSTPDGTNTPPPSSSSATAAATTSESDYFSPLAIVHLIHLLNPLVEARALFSNTSPTDFLPLYSLELRDAVLGYLLSLEDEDLLKTTHRRTISRPLLQVELIMTAAAPHITDAEVRRTFEMFELEWGWLYARNKSLPLDRRITAINDIKDVIEYVERKEEYLRRKASASAAAGTVLGYVNAAVTSSLSMTEAPPAFMKQWLTNEVLCQWIITNGVLELLLDPATTHIELVRRSFTIMKALSAQPSASTAGSSAKGAPVAAPLLTTHHLDLLWQLSCMGNHESIEHLVYDIVARLSATLPVSLMKHIFERMCEKAFASYDGIFLTLVYNFTLHTLRPDSAVAQAAAAATNGSANKAPRQTYGIDLFWSLLQSPHTRAIKPGVPSPTSASASASTAPSEDVLTRARNYLLDLLSMDGALPLRMQYMDRCVMNVKGGVLVGRSLDILLRLIDLHPVKSSKWFSSGASQTRSVVIEGLEQKYGLLNLILEEMSQYQTKANQDLKQLQQQQQQQLSSTPLSPGTLASSSTSSPPSSTAALTRVHLFDLELRQEFLVSILQHLTLTLSKPQIDLIWRSLVQQATSSHARDSVFAWLIDACDSDGLLLTEEVKAHLFHVKLLTLPPATLSSMAFKLVIKYFLRVHAKAGVMKVDDASSSGSGSSKNAPSESEFTLLLARHRRELPVPSSSAAKPKKLAKSSSSATSNAFPFGKPALLSSVSDITLAPTEYTAISDEDQLLTNPVLEASILAWTQKLCSSLTVSQYSEVKGIAFLWHVMLRNPRARVARQSAVLLTTIHQNLSSKLRQADGTPESPSQIRDAHLKSCLSNMSRALQESSAVAADPATDLQVKKRVSRCIYALKTFLHGFSHKADPCALAPPPTGSIVVHVRPSREYRVEPFDLTLQLNDTIGDLRSAIYAHLSQRNPNTSLKSLCIIWDKKKLLTNYLVIGTIGMEHGDEITAKRHSDLFAAYQPSAAVLTSPSASIFTSIFFDVLDDPWQEMQGREKYATTSLMDRRVSNEDAARSWARKSQHVDASLASIASDPASFDRLFTLLTPNSPMSESVFDILMLLPTSLNSLRTFLNLHAITAEKWPVLLDVKSVYRLLYSLQVLEEILATRAHDRSGSSRSAVLQALGPDQKQFDLGAWCQTFIQKGGVKYLVAIAVNSNWQQTRPTTAVTIGGGTARRTVSVPRAIYHEVQQSLFTLLHTFFSFDPLFPDGPPSGEARAVRLANGTWSSARLPNWDAWIRQIVKDGIVASILHTQVRDAQLSDGGETIDATSRDDNSTSMIIAGMRLLVACIQAVPVTIDAVFYQQPAQTLELLTVLLLKTSSAAARTQAAQSFLTIFQLSHRHASPTQQLFWAQLLVQILRSPSLRVYEQQTEELFLLVVSYLDFLCSSSLRATYVTQLSALDLPSIVLDLLRDHTSTEQYEAYLQVDVYLAGLLQVARCTITHRLAPKDVIAHVADVDGPLMRLLSYVYNECLFHTPAHDAAQGCKCKSHSSRIMAMGVLLEMSAVFEPCYAALLRMVTTHESWNVKRPATQWGYDPTQLEKSSALAPVGLKNQGATCYMNSFLQVLFSAKEFCAAIMTMRHPGNVSPTIGPADAPPPASPSLSGTVVPSPAPVAFPAVSAAASFSPISALRELQLLFGHLAWSQKSYFDTLDFCQTLRDYSGAPINVGEQKDVNEFASMLFDQLEQEMNQMGGGASADANATTSDDTKSSESATSTALVPSTNASNRAIIDHTFKGSLVHEILSQRAAECPHTTSREEAFYMISLTVVNKSSVDQSLANFVEGDLLDGDNKYMCGQCKKKVTALKRCCFHDTHLPQYLILHLKRFEFNFDTMRKEKVNDYFEFPYKEGDYLNIEKYTQSGLARAEAAKNAEKNDGEAAVPPPPAADPKPEGFYDYELVGVLIHGGSAEGGHYITLCKTETPVDPTTTTRTAGDASTDAAAPASVLYEFNDQLVRVFDPSDIPASCFGGTEHVEMFDKTTNQTMVREVVNNKNAYMCIYKRRWKQTEEKAREDADDNNATNTPSDTTPASTTPEPVPSPAGTSPTLSASPAPTPLLTPIPTPVTAAPSAIWSYDRTRADLCHFPADILDAVWGDNIGFLHEKYLFEWNTNWFVWNLMQLHLPVSATRSTAVAANLADTTPRSIDGQSWSSAQTVPLAQIGLRYVFDVLARSAENASFPQWIDLLYQLFDWDASARGWFLDFIVADAPDGTVQASPFLHTLLFECPQPIVREAICDLIVFVVSAAREDRAERALYFPDSDEPSARSRQAMHSRSSTPILSPDTAKSIAAGATPTAHATQPSGTVPPTLSLSGSAPSSLPPPSQSAPPTVSTRPRSSVTRVLQWCLDMLPSVKRHHRIYNEFWRLFYSLAKIGQDERRWMIQQGAIQRLAAFYLDQDPLVGFNITAAYGGEAPKRKHANNAFWMLQLMSIIVRSCETDTLPQTGPSPSQTHRTLVPLLTGDRDLLLLGWCFPAGAPDGVGVGVGAGVGAGAAAALRPLMPWLLSDRQNATAVCEIAVHWCWEQVTFSCRLVDLLLRLIVSELTTAADVADYRLLLQCFVGVVCIADSPASQSSRVDYAFTELFVLLQKVVVRNKVGDQRLLFTAVQHILKAAYQSKAVTAWTAKNGSKYAGWLAEYKRVHVDVATAHLNAAPIGFAR